jgi:hypothetical protein
MTESHAEQISRVEQMAQGDSGTWDLSLNDEAALRTVVQERRDLLTALKDLIAWVDVVEGDDLPEETLLPQYQAARAAIQKAESR